MDTRRKARTIVRAAFLVLFAAGAASADAPGAAAPGAGVATGTWQKHQYSFVSMSFTSTYSCDGLADKLKVLLLASGARTDVKASGICSNGFGRPDKLARVDLTFYTLIPDTILNTADGERANGTWRSVKLTAHSPRELGLGDCELVDQFRNQLLPMFATRDVSSQTTCVPHQDSGSNINLSFESLAALPPQPPIRAAN